MRALEFALLFLVVPLLFATGTVPLRLPAMAGIWGGLTLGSLLVLRSNTEFRAAMRRVPSRRDLKRIFFRFLLVAAALLLLQVVLVPDRWFDFPRRAPGLWLAVLILYPLFSAAPQEVLYRTFFFERYAACFGSPRRLVWASAAAFGFLHVIFGNPVAPLLACAGGWIFARTYEKTRSFPAVALEHALYGGWLFTVGLGSYFYHGRVG